MADSVQIVRSTARQQQICFVLAPFMLRFALLPAFSFGAAKAVVKESP